MFTFIRRVVGAAALRSSTYEEVEADRSATPQALAVVLLASVGTGIGWTGLGGDRIWTTVVLSALAVAAWIAWALMTYLIGVHLLPEGQTQADPGQLLRTLGFAQSPPIFNALGAVPGIGAPLLGVTAVWALASMVVAVRQALDYSSTMRAVWVCAAGWILALVMFGVIGVFFSAPVS